MDHTLAREFVVVETKFRQIDTFPKFAPWAFAPWAFYAHFYSHAHRHRLRLEFSTGVLEVPKGVLNNFWIQIAVSEAERPSRNRFGSGTAINTNL